MYSLRKVSITCLLGICLAGHAQQITVYPAPDGAELNGDFTVSVRQGTQAWKTLPAYLINVDEVR
ncbi:MAG: hypothetical protein LBG28_05270, partial [Tannerella sp.]|nr:hypothetical protein [Tannerella sp.]